MNQDSPEVLSLFESQLDLVDIIARQVIRDVGEVIEFDEMRSFGQEGLLMAARRFDPSLGTPFRRYAGYRIKGAIYDGLRSFGRLPRRAHEKVRALRAANAVAEGFVEDTEQALRQNVSAAAVDERLQHQLAVMATAMAVGFGGEHAIDDNSEVIRVSDGPSPEQALAAAEMSRLLHEKIDKLPEREAVLVRRHFLKEEKLDDIIEELGISRSWASRLLNRGVDRLTRMLRDAQGG